MFCMWGDNYVLICDDNDVLICGVTMTFDMW